MFLKKCALARTFVVKDPAEAELNDGNLDGSAFLTVFSTTDCALAVSTPSLALAANLKSAIAFAPSA